MTGLLVPRLIAARELPGAAPKRMLIVRSPVQSTTRCVCVCVCYACVCVRAGAWVVETSVLLPLATLQSSCPLSTASACYVVAAVHVVRYGWMVAVSSGLHQQSRSSAQKLDSSQAAGSVCAAYKMHLCHY